MCIRNNAHHVNVPDLAIQAIFHLQSLAGGCDIKKTFKEKQHISTQHSGTIEWVSYKIRNNTNKKYSSLCVDYLHQMARRLHLPFSMSVVFFYCGGTVNNSLSGVDD